MEVPDDPPVSVCRLNASCWQTNTSVRVTMANVAARVRSASQPIGTAAIATPAPMAGKSRNGP